MPSKPSQKEAGSKKIAMPMPMQMNLNMNLSSIPGMAQLPTQIPILKSDFTKNPIHN